jgi:hypothetical protein
MLLPSAVERDPRIAAWFATPHQELRLMIQPWYKRLRDAGADVRELLHDGYPIACVGEAAFAYVDAFAAHASVGFFQGASLEDPADLLEGSGKRMRHVKLHWGQPVNEAALAELISAAYRDMRQRTSDAD